jgi:hypothetical protein
MARIAERKIKGRKMYEFINLQNPQRKLHRKWAISMEHI